MLFFFLFVLGYSKNIYAVESSDIKTGKVQIGWDKVKGAAKYQVQIVDLNNEIVLNRIVDVNQIDFTLPPGKYRIKIGAINKYNNVGSWSDWEDLEIEKPEDDIQKDKLEKKDISYIGLKFGIGMSYYQILPEWKSLYKNSYLNGTLSISYYPENIDFFKSYWFLRYLGIELDTTFVLYQGKNAINRVETDNYDLIVCGNLLIKTGFDFPLNLIARVGGGKTLTWQKYNTYDVLGNIEGTETLDSSDPYYNVGLAIEYTFLSYFFLEIGANYSVIKYIDNGFKTLRYICLFGVKI